MAKHTQGNWKEYKGNIVTESKSELPIDFDANICKLNTFLEEAEANAKLIAAAPELLEALEETTNTLKFLSEHLTEAGKMELQKALLIIQKATN